MDKPYEQDKAHETLEMLAKAHPFLRSTIAYEKTGKKLFYAVSDSSKTQVLEKDDAGAIWYDYEEIGKREWNVFENGLLKVLLYPEKTSFQILFIAHHLLGDGRTILGLATEFADAYVKGIKPGYVEERKQKSYL